LPKALRSDEVERLLGALGDPSRSSRRDDAIVRCALDLGLRGGEVANLGFDDIDWRAGTVTLRRTKSRREDVLPLPEATGRAIADYLKFERSRTTNRAVFVRRIAPRDQPIGPDLVRKAIRQAYARAGLPYGNAQTLVQVLKQCGDNLTRENVMKQAANLKNFESGVLLPGIKINTSATDFAPIESVQLARFDGKEWARFGEILGK
jgi:hypothetical protein